MALVLHANCNLTCYLALYLSHLFSHTIITKSEHCVVANKAYKRERERASESCEGSGARCSCPAADWLSAAARICTGSAQSAGLPPGGATGSAALCSLQWAARSPLPDDYVLMKRAPKNNYRLSIVVVTVRLLIYCARQTPSSGRPCPPCAGSIARLPVAHRRMTRMKTVR